MKDTAVIGALVLLLASSHMVLSSRTVRARLVAQFGETPFLVGYSIVALVLTVPLFHFYFTHRHLGPQLWAVPEAGPVEVALVLANAFGVVMLVAGLLDQGPASFMGKPREGPTGAHRITRHPTFMGVAVMALAHAVANSHATDVAFFGGHRRLLRWWDAGIRTCASSPRTTRRSGGFTPRPSFLPFTGRGALRGLRELPPLAVIVGVVAAVDRALPASVGRGLRGALVSHFCEGDHRGYSIPPRPWGGRR